MSQPVPRWLAQFNNGDSFNREHFFASRIVYYPGSGTDGQPVKLFGSTHSAHCYVYADYGITQAHLEAELGNPSHGFSGYHTLARVQLSEKDLAPRGWRSHVDPEHMSQNDRGLINTLPFGFLEVLERDHALDDSHGAHRLAILFLGADGIAAYDALFCQENGTPPFAVVLEDHGFGGNYDRFGCGGLLERIAKTCDAIPQWLVVAKNTKPWAGFSRIPEVTGDPGGMHHTPRYIYVRENMQRQLA
jgi:hypothetical protein